MDTQPRAEDENLPLDENLSQEPVVSDEAQQEHVAVETASSEAILPDGDGEIAIDEATSEDDLAVAGEPDFVSEPSQAPGPATGQAAEAPLELVMPDEAAEIAASEALESRAQERVTDADEDELSVELSPEDLAVDEAVPTEALQEAVLAQVVADAPSIAAEFVTETEFAQLVDDAIESFGGILLFKMRLDEGGIDKHVAAASIGDGARRQFLLLSLPATGGKLSVESASRSNSPLAKLAEAYVGVVEAFRAAA